LSTVAYLERFIKSAFLDPFRGYGRIVMVNEDVCVCSDKTVEQLILDINAVLAAGATVGLLTLGNAVVNAIFTYHTRS
jgi:hypothetical protein